MENEMNQDFGQPMDQQPEQEIPSPPNQQAPPIQQMNPGAYTYPPYYHHHKFWEKKVNLSLWQCVAAGVLIVILAFGLGMSCGKVAGARKMRRMAAPFMMQIPNGGAQRRGNFQIPGNGYSQNPYGSYQMPNGNSQGSNNNSQNSNGKSQGSGGGFQIPNGNSQNPNGSFQIPNGNSGNSSGQNGYGYGWKR